MIFLILFKWSDIFTPGVDPGTEVESSVSFTRKCNVFSKVSWGFRLGALKEKVFQGFFTGIRYF